MIAGDLAPLSGGGRAQRRARRDAPVHRLDPRRQRGPRTCCSTSPRRRCATAGAALEAAELAMMERDDEKTQMAYAQALSDWGDAGGYEAEVVWDVCTTAALGVPYEKAHVPRAVDAVGRRAEAAGARGAAARARRGAAARRAGQLPRRPGQALARGGARRVAEDGAVRQPRPRAAAPHRDPRRHHRGARHVGARRGASRPTPRPGRPGASGSPSCTSAGTRSTSGCGS